MEVILTEDVPNLGPQGKVVQVAPGYFLNYLDPRKLAIRCQYKKQWEHEKKRLKFLALKKQATAEALAKRLEGLTLRIVRKMGEHAMHGSVTAQDIQHALHAEGVEMDRRKLMLPSQEPIKALGVYDVTAHLAGGVRAVVKVQVVAD